jgi:hypothetical protein
MRLGVSSNDSTGKLLKRWWDSWHGWVLPPYPPPAVAASGRAAPPLRQNIARAASISSARREGTLPTEAPSDHIHRVRCGAPSPRRSGSGTTIVQIHRSRFPGGSVIATPPARTRSRKLGPPHVLDALHEASRGWHHSEETRRKMSESHRKRGTMVPGTKVWTAQEDEWVKSLPVEEAARRTGRSVSAVYKRRHRLGIPDERRRN